MPSRVPAAPDARKRHRRVRGALLAAVLLGACATRAIPVPGRGGQTLPPPGESAAGPASGWVDRTLEGLDLRGRVGQLVMVWMTGGYASDTDEEFLRVRERVLDDGIGGIVMSLGTPLDYVSRLNRLQSDARVPLLVAADFEAGAGFRLGGIYALPAGLDLGGATVFPPAMAFGAADDERLAYEAGRITAVEGRALGVHIAFAPVLDVNNNPANPIINTRSFGERPDRVGALGTAFIAGARDAGLMTTAKHFPGHGDTGTDSHLALPVITGDRGRLDRVELVPFRRAVAAGVDAVMTAHIAAPAILGDATVPATLSPYFMTRVLREEMGFRGALFTDALDMGAIVATWGGAGGAIRALAAGADVLLMPPDPHAVIDSVVAAVGDGRLTRTRIDEAARRVLEMKARAGLDRSRLVDPGAVIHRVGTAEHRAFADTVARRSLTLVRDPSHAVPLDTAVRRRLLAITVARADDLPAGRTFDARLGEAASVLRARLDVASDGAVWDSVAGLADSVDAVLVSAYLPPRTAEGTVEAPPAFARLLGRVAGRGRPLVVLSFGSPYLTEALPEGAAYLIAWGGIPALQRAAAEAVLGVAAIDGRLPISLPPYHAVGAGLTRRTGARASVGMDSAGLAAVDRLIDDAIARGVTPGAALAVGRHGRLVRRRGYGRTDWSPDAPAATDSTLWDLASLTKVVVTTTAIMRLVDQGRLSLDDPIGAYLPEWAAGWKKGVTVRDLLLHRGGLPPFRPFWRTLRGRSAYRTAIADLDPEYPPGARTVYSDLGLITLGFVVEALEGRGLDAVARETIFEPLGMGDTGFRPPPGWRGGIAPTEVDTAFRHRHLRGEVHDENAWALGGVAGHAGLFSSARDLARFAGWLLDATRGRGVSPPELPTPATVRAFSRRAGPESSRALGWDTPSERSSAGRYLSPAAFGHTGFTGTSIWVDPDLDLFVVLLTSRVNPTRENRGHIPLRRAVHDAVASSIRDQPVPARR